MTEYQYTEDSGHTETEHLNSDEEALEWARELLRDGSWGSEETTAHVSARVSRDDGDGGWDDVDTVTVAIDPVSPACARAEHSWQSPHALVGGCETNPGVWGDAGGVTTHEACVHCGCQRITETKRGLTSIEYHGEHYGRGDADDEDFAAAVRRGVVS